ncbi:MAG: LysM peptidoglycan-binding domain-containing protein, partial [Verrucomicrobiota bacterium]
RPHPRRPGTLRTGGERALRLAILAPPCAHSDQRRTTYVVQAGDTLSTIGQELGVNYRELMRANGITDPTRLRVGQVLIVPNAEPRANSDVSPASRGTPPARTEPATPAPRQDPPTLFAPPSLPAEIDGEAAAEEEEDTMSPEDLEAMLDDLPVNESESVNEGGNGGQ